MNRPYPSSGSKLYSNTETYLWSNAVFFIVQFALWIAMFVMFMDIEKIQREQEAKRKSFSDQSANNWGDPTNTCLSKDAVQKFTTYQKNMSLVVWVIFVSALYNLWYIAFHSIMPQNKWVLGMIYFPIFVMGVVCIGFSTNNFVQLKSISNQPIECQALFKKFKTLFTLSLIAGCTQSILPLWVAFNSFDISIN